MHKARCEAINEAIQILSKAEDWAVQAATLPVAFAQTREDAYVDLTALRLIKPGADVIMVASGGCTLASIAGSGLARSIHAVDINSAQIALSKYKLQLLHQVDAPTRLALLGHLPTKADIRHKNTVNFCQSHNLPVTVFGDLDFVSDVGLDYCGRFEQVFKQLQNDLQAMEMSKNAAGKEFTDALRQAFKRIMSQANLTRVFGEAATNNRLMPFDRHFLLRTTYALDKMPLATNPYLQQVLLGRFSGETLLPWLHLPPVKELPRIRFSLQSMQEALTQASAAYDFVHLSNILDWVDAGEAQVILQAAVGALRPGGLILARQLNSPLDYKSASAGLPITLLDGTASRLHASDRSFLYRAIYLGRTGQK